MSRSISRLLVVLATCLAVAFLIGGVVMARGQSPAGRAVSQSTPSGMSGMSGAPVSNVQAPYQVANNSGPGTSTPPANAIASAADPDGDSSGPEASGTVASIDPSGSAFVLTTAQGSVPCVVSAQTIYADGLRSIADVHAGMALYVEGPVQPDGSIAATQVEGTNEVNDAPESGVNADPAKPNNGQAEPNNGQAEPNNGQ